MKRAYVLRFFLFTVVATICKAQTYKDLHNFSCCSGPDRPEILAQGRDGNIYGTIPRAGSSGNGIIFRATPSGGFAVIHNFNGRDGSSAAGGLVLGLDGNLYGAASEGGTSGAGTLFKVTPSGILTVLHNFAVDFSDGGAPRAPVLGADGNFYGLASLGVAYRVSSAGVFKILTRAIPGGSNAPLVQAKDGNFYGVTVNGGNMDQGTIFRMSPSGAVKILYSFDDVHGCQPEGPLTEALDANLYGTTPRCGPDLLSEGVAFKITRGGLLTVLHAFDSSHPETGYHPLAGLVAATDGNLYGVTGNDETGGLTDLGLLFRLSKSGSFTGLHSFTHSTGAYPDATPMQHTNGKLYGLTRAGGTADTGVLYNLDLGIAPFALLVNASGKVGTVVQVLGGGFTGTSAVKFGSAKAAFTVVSDTFLTAVVPSAATTAFVTVTTPVRTLVSSKQFRVVPTIASFSTVNGPVGTQVAIKGTGLNQTNKVTFGGVKATTFAVNSPTQVTATVPAGAATGKIAVTTLGGVATSATSFTVSGGACSKQGQECAPQLPPCCPGLVCVPASTRAFCEPASAKAISQWPLDGIAARLR